VHDLSQKLPFGNEYFDGVYCSHVIEHLPKGSVQMFFRECHRVLLPGGVLRTVIPDLERIARIYLEMLDGALRGESEAQKKYEWIVIEMLDQLVRNQSGGEMLKYWRQNPMPAEHFVIERTGSEVLNLLKIVRGASSDPGTTADPEGPADPEKIGAFRLSGEIHQWMYDRYSLRGLLEESGFEAIKQCKADESAIPDFNSYLLDIEKGGSIRKPDSLFMEAVKPSSI
jgi:SAM-dependent methyltransferase